MKQALEGWGGAAAILWVVGSLASCGREPSARERLLERAEETLQRAGDRLDVAANKASQSMERMQRLFEGHREQAELSLESTLAEFGAQFERVVDRVSATGERGSEALERELDQRLGQLRAKLDEMKTSSEEQWRDRCKQLELEVDALAEKLSQKLEERER